MTCPLIYEMGESMGSHSHLCFLHCFVSQQGALHALIMLSHDGNVQRKAFAFGIIICSYRYLEWNEGPEKEPNQPIPLTELLCSIRGTLFLCACTFLCPTTSQFYAHEIDVTKWQYKHCTSRHIMWVQPPNQIPDLKYIYSRLWVILFGINKGWHCLISAPCCD